MANVARKMGYKPKAHGIGDDPLGKKRIYDDSSISSGVEVIWDPQTGRFEVYQQQVHIATGRASTYEEFGKSANSWIRQRQIMKQLDESRGTVSKPRPMKTDAEREAEAARKAVKSSDGMHIDKPRSFKQAMDTLTGVEKQKWLAGPRFVSPMAEKWGVTGSIGPSTASTI